MMRPRVLWLSQLASPAERVGRCVPYERDFAPATLPLAEVQVVDVTVDPLPPVGDFVAVVVGGSVGCALDPDPWRLSLRAWLRAWRGPFLGICGGHQLYALAAGGEVTRGGFDQVGPCPLAIPELGVSWVAQAHHDAVTRVPDGATVWARDAVCVQALRYGPARWTTQFHPEVDAHTVRGLWANGGVHDAEAGLVGEVVEGGRRLMAAWWREVGA